MVAAVYYYATPDDHAKLLDYIDEPVKASLHPWPFVDSPPTLLTRDQALTMPQVMVIHRDFGPPSVIRPGDAAMTEPTRAGLFNRVNWDRSRPAAREGLVDSNASPVLFWEPGPVTDSDIRVSKIGSQADAMGAISADYERWANRVMGWIRRKGTKVWGLERSAVRGGPRSSAPLRQHRLCLAGRTFSARATRARSVIANVRICRDPRGHADQRSVHALRYALMREMAISAG